MNINILNSEKFLGKSGDRTLFAVKCHSGKDIRRHSYYTDESEIILSAARKFKVVGHLDHGHGLTMIQLEEIEPEIVLIEPASGGNNKTRPGTATLMKRSLPVQHHNPKLKSQIEKYSFSTRIDLTFHKLSGQDMSVVVDEAIAKKACVELDLSDNTILSEGLALLALALRTNKTLQVLSLSSNGISDEGVGFLTDSLSNHNSTLRVLGLGSIGITDEGAKSLSQMLKVNRTLRGLALQNNRIGSSGIEQLMRVLIDNNKSLQTLNVSHNMSINDSCVDSVIKMLTCNTTLQELYLLKTSLSNASAKQIRQTAKSKSDFEFYV